MTRSITGYQSPPVEPLAINPTQVCGVCKFSRNQDGGFAECHYYPPQWRESGGLGPVWPIVADSDWCGMFST